MTTSINLSDSQLTGLARIRGDMGFRSTSHLVRFLVDEAIAKHGMTVRKSTGWTQRPGDIMQRVLSLPAGSKFTAAGIAKRDEDLSSVGNTLHYLHRHGKVGLLRNARRVGNKWEPAIFVRKDIK